MQEVYTKYSQIPIMINAKDLSKILGISLSQTYCLLNSHEFPTIKLGKRLLVSKLALKEWLSQCNTKP